uniref:CX domain-containing protein n=1 Tax=Meloidogyne hapla TaxID=6305 RepID=A0A1I8B0S2_MELHA
MSIAINFLRLIQCVVVIAAFVNLTKASEGLYGGLYGGYGWGAAPYWHSHDGHEGWNGQHGHHGHGVHHDGYGKHGDWGHDRQGHDDWGHGYKHKDNHGREFCIFKVCFG